METSTQVAELIARIDLLEQRVSRLEHEPAPLLPESHVPLEISLPHIGEPSLAQAGGTFSTLGKAMLGMAGAYILRAIAESGSFPWLAIIILAIAYASMWMAWAARVAARQWLASGIYAATSALILAPMLSELILRFQVLSPAAAAAVLVLFLAGTFVLAWTRNLAPAIWVAVLATAVTSIALLFATHAIEPFLAALLLTALLTEAASIRNRWLSLRPIAALAADFGVWSVLFVYGNPEAARADYPSLPPAALLAPGLILIAIYGASAVSRTALLSHRFTAFEVFQTSAAFLLALETVLRLGSQQVATVFGVSCLMLSLAASAAAFTRFTHSGPQRNYRVYSTWALALFLTGSFLSFTPEWCTTVLGAAAILTSVLAVPRSLLTPAFHGVIYLLAASFACGYLSYVSATLVGAFPAAPPAIAWLVAAAAVFCYAAIGTLPASQYPSRILRNLSAFLAVSAIAASLIFALVRITASVLTPGDAHIAVIRTLAGCILAIALAGIGPRIRRTELAWISYALLALLAAKLLFEDLRHGHPEFTAASIFLYAITLMLVPPLVRRSGRKSAPAAG